MEFLHIIPGSTGNILDFLGCMENREDFSEHRFMTMVTREGIIKGCPEMLAYPFVENFEKHNGRFKRIRDYFSLRRRLKQADRIIWHGLTTGGGKFTLLLFMNRKICAKSVWIENGSDEENWTQYGNALKRRMFNHIQKAVRKKIPVAGVSFPGNRGYLKELWPDKTVFDTPYPINADYVQDALRVRAMRAGKTLPSESEAEKALEGGACRHLSKLPVVQVGINSQALNAHTRLMLALDSKKESPVLFFFPMNYRIEGLETGSGVRGYTDRIKRTSRAKFGERIVVLNQRVLPGVFFRCLYRIDAAVLNGQTSFSSTYLWFLLLSGVKLYLPEDSNLSRFLQENGISVHPLEKIEEESYEEFFRAPCSSFPDPLMGYLDRERVMDCWSRLFAFLKAHREG